MTGQGTDRANFGARISDSLSEARNHADSVDRTGRKWVKGGLDRSIAHGAHGLTWKRRGPGGGQAGEAAKGRRSSLFDVEVWKGLSHQECV